MNTTNFKLHTDCEYPCIHLEVYLGNELVSDSEIDIYSQIKYLDNAMIQEYNDVLNTQFITKCDELKQLFGNSIAFRDKNREVEVLQNKKRILDAALNERDSNE